MGITLGTALICVEGKSIDSITYFRDIYNSD